MIAYIRTFQFYNNGVINVTALRKRLSTDLPTIPTQIPHAKFDNPTVKPAAKMEYPIMF